MIDPIHCRDANERRQASVIADLADEHARIGAGVMSFTPDTKWICKAVGVDLDAPLDKETADAVVAWFRERGVPPVLELTSLSHEDTFEIAAEAGFDLVQVENVLAVVPESVREDVLEMEPPPGVELRRLDTADDAEVRRYAEIVTSGFVPPGSPLPEGMVESGIRSQHMATSAGWLACDMAGEPIAAAGSEVVDVGEGEGAQRLLALCGTTVLPAHRRRGLQRNLMARRLAMGVERGCTMALVESKPGIATERNAARLGFELAYTRLVLRAPA